MFNNKEAIKNKIIYRSQYRGTKEMDILMSSFVKSIIDNLNYNELEELNLFVDLDDRELQKIKNQQPHNYSFRKELIDSFVSFKE
tara:strand:+ start:398 stop:652 length:255 start_codon:yes stop_codon:yes gene_type:complete